MSSARQYQAEALKMLSLTLVLMTETSITSDLQLMVELAVTQKGRPKIRGIYLEA